MTDDMLLLVDEMEENMQKAQEAMKNESVNWRRVFTIWMRRFMHS